MHLVQRHLTPIYDSWELGELGLFGVRACVPEELPSYASSSGDHNKRGSPFFSPLTKLLGLSSNDHSVG